MWKSRKEKVAFKERDIVKDELLVIRHVINDTIRWLSNYVNDNSTKEAGKTFSSDLAEFLATYVPASGERVVRPLLGASALTDFRDKLVERKKSIDNNLPKEDADHFRDKLDNLLAFINLEIRKEKGSILDR